MRSAALLVAALFLAAGAVAEEAGRPVPGDGGGQMVMAPAANPAGPGARGPDFKPYIFWAYGLACLLIFLFILWTLSQLRRVEERVEYLVRTQAERRPGEG